MVPKLDDKTVSRAYTRTEVKKPNGGKKHERNFNEAAFRGRCSFRTRLHAGIRSMNIGNRSLVIGVDNRARAMKHDINLPVLERNEMQEKLEEIIEQKWATEVHLPVREIERWKKQFQ